MTTATAIKRDVTETYQNSQTLRYAGLRYSQDKQGRHAIRLGVPDDGEPRLTLHQTFDEADSQWKAHKAWLAIQGYDTLIRREIAHKRSDGNGPIVRIVKKLGGNW